MRRIPWNVIAVWLYMLSIVLPAVVAPSFQLFGRGHDEYLLGLQCMAIGWLTPAWYANLALASGLIAKHYECHGLAMVWALLALGLGLASTSFFFEDITPFVGCYVWLASIASIAAFVVGTSVTFLTPVTPVTPVT